MTNIIEQLDSEQIKSDIPEFAPGDTIRVQVKVKEGSRERLQAFEGVVIARKNRGLNSSFTVRKISYGEGVERVFQTHSPCGGQSSITCAAAQGSQPGFERKFPDSRPTDLSRCLCNRAQITQRLGTHSRNLPQQPLCDPHDRFALGQAE